VATSGVAAYRRVLSVPDARRILLLGTVIRVPLWAGSVVLTLHVVSHLHRSYGAAGALAGVATVALALSSPWRGRRLDRIGLRRAVGPTLLILAACWSIAPFTGYWPLLVLAGLANLFTVPTFSIVRQALLHATDEADRRSALAIDSVLVEVSFMIGPALGVLLAQYISTPWAMFACEFAVIAGGLALCIANPALRPDAGASATGTARSAAAGARRALLSPAVVAVMVMSAAATIVLTGTDVGVVAALRHLHHQSYVGWELAVWGLGSAVGGLVYGLLHRSLPVVLLLVLLALCTFPIALATTSVAIAVALFVAGLFCAPTITAAIDTLTRLVPESVRGEALGWHGSALTVGSAVGAPVAGVAIDALGWTGAFTVSAILALATAVVGGTLLHRSGGTGAGVTEPQPDGHRPRTEATR
jgi:MFS family permease